MKFQAITDFKSSEFSGTQYVSGLTYIIRAGNKKLVDMCEKWLKAKRFIPGEDFTVLGIEFVAGRESYVLPGDDLELIIDAKVAAGKAEYTGIGLITFEIYDDASGEISGSAVRNPVGA